MTMQNDRMRDYPPSLAATKKIGGVPDGFEFFAFEWLGDRPEEWTVMKCSGAVFREAKSGPRKGKRCIKIPGSERTVFVTEEQINAEAPNDRVQAAPLRGVAPATDCSTTRNTE